MAPGTSRQVSSCNLNGGSSLRLLRNQMSPLRCHGDFANLRFPAPNPGLLSGVGVGIAKLALQDEAVPGATPGPSEVTTNCKYKAGGTSRKGEERLSASRRTLWGEKSKSIPQPKRSEVP